MRVWSIHPKYLDTRGLLALWREAHERGFNFDRNKFTESRAVERIDVTKGQLGFEREHLPRKLKVRDPRKYRVVPALDNLDIHPLFHLIKGGIEPWEKT
jgi:hypothetical protein